MATITPFNGSLPSDCAVPGGVSLLRIEMTGDEVVLPDNAQADVSDLLLEFVGWPSPPPRRAGDFIYAEADGTGIRVARIRIWKSGSQAYLEAHTSPRWVGFTQVDMRRLDYARRDANVELLRRGMGLLYPHPFRARPSGTASFNTSDEWNAAYRGAVGALRHEGIKPTPDLVADKLAVSRRTFYDYRRRFGIPE